MELANLLFQKVVIMLVFLVVGYVCSKTKLISQEGNKSITNLVLYVCTPLLIFTSFQQEFTEKLLRGLLVTIAISVAGYAATIIAAYFL